MNTLRVIESHYRDVIPLPSDEDFAKAMAAYVKSMIETMDSLEVTPDCWRWLWDLKRLQDDLVHGRLKCRPKDRGKLLNALAEQVFSVVRVSHCAGLGLVDYISSAQQEDKLP